MMNIILIHIKANTQTGSSFTSLVSSLYTQKNVTLHQVDIFMSNCWISWQLFL